VRFARLTLLLPFDFKEQTMNILLTGTSGFIGSSVLTELLGRGYRVTACCRNPKQLNIRHHHLATLAIDFNEVDSIAAWLPHLQGIDAVVNCVGIIAETRTQRFETLHTKVPSALFTAAARAGVGKVVQISALGADDAAVSPYHVSKKAADEVLRQLPLDWFVLQPSLVYGDGGQSAALFHALAALPIHWLPDGGQQFIQPVDVEDVAAAVGRCLDADTAGGKTLALVGPEAITYADWLAGLRWRLGKREVAVVSVPMRYAKLAAGFGRWIGEPVLNPDSIAMLARGNSADVSGFSEFLGRPPANVTTHLFERTASQAERWQAGLYFLRPAAGWIVALVWLWSGITSLFFYPHDLSYRLLAETGIAGWLAPVSLYGLALMDITFGTATLCRYRIRSLLLWQCYVVLGYSIVVACRLPEFVFHPFGPLLKNLPFLALLLVYRVLEGERP
jgi:uncharacterized protein YbjT (DUF2867 family)